MVEKLRTDDRLLERLKEAASKPITKQKLERQRVSFVFGNLPTDSTITREMVAARIRRMEGE